MSSFYNTGSTNLFFLNQHTIYEKVVKCTVKNYEINFSYNPSMLISGSSVKYFVTGSDFHPYITTVGLYNDSNDLLAVGKFGQPVPMPTETDISFIIKMDI